MAPSKKRPKSAWPAGFGALAITVSPPPTTAPFDHGELQLVAEVGHQRRQIRDQRVVVERRQERGAEEQRRLGEAGEHRRDPPALQPAVDHEAREEEARPAAESCSSMRL